MQKTSKKKKYILDMFPYPSGDGLHVGHVESYTATDILSRFYRMKGEVVLHPQGWDAFGLPAENYAIKTGIHPSETTKKSITTFKEQMKKMNFSYDWDREINSSDPAYYKWTQWFFLLLYKNGYAYRGKANVNFCPKCQTVLANEQVVNGKCERCETEVIQKDLEQWFFKITDFIEDAGKTSGLIAGLNKVDWPESTKAAQKNWIGRSEGALIKFPIVIPSEVEESKIRSSRRFAPQDDNYLEVFTTRLDTIYGCTYCVVAPEHPLIKNYESGIKNYEEVKNYLVQARNKTELERMETKDKTGVEIKGIKAVNLFTNEEVPIFVADYVLGHYGTGAVMAVPAHDERDFEFAKKYNLKIKTSIAVPSKKYIENAERRDGVATLITNKEGKILVMRDKLLNKFNFPRGGIEKGESLKIAAIRESQEETGYKNFKVVADLGCLESYFYAKDKKINRHRFLCGFHLVLIDNIKIEVNEEDKDRYDILWMNYKEAIRRLGFSEDKYFVEYLNSPSCICFSEDGILINSEKYSGLTSEKAREEMTKWLEKEKLGSRKINYKLRDWLVSRQRYWGAPIPIIYCDKCGTVPVSEKDLPVVLPDDVDFNPTGESPLVHSKKFHNVKCPTCGAKARRESDTMDTFVCSSWYYFRYADPKNDKEFASSANIKKWLPVDIYVGGAEHTVLHLLYSRFFTKVLHRLGFVDFDEPFLKLRHQGIILGEDNYKMSKSRGNVINPDDVIKEYGADALRMFEMFMGPLEDMKPWNTKGIVGIKRFLDKVYKLQSKASDQETVNNKIDNLLHKTIKKVTEDIGHLKFNTAISQMMILVNEMEKQHAKSATANAPIRINDFKKLLILLSPFAPHISEELWLKLGNKESIFKEKWPEYDPKLIKDEEIEFVVQVNGKVRDRIKVSADLSEEEAKKLALESQKVKSFTNSKVFKKVIFVPGKLINIVVN